MGDPNSGVLATPNVSIGDSDKPSLIGEVAAWEESRNKHHAKANWQFTPKTHASNSKRCTHFE